MKEKKDNWLKSLFGYAQGFEGKLTASVILSVTSIMAGGGAVFFFFCYFGKI